MKIGEGEIRIALLPYCVIALLRYCRRDRVSDLIGREEKQGISIALFVLSGLAVLFLNYELNVKR
jgi:hypothetical protein